MWAAGAVLLGSCWRRNRRRLPQSLTAAGTADPRRAGAAVRRARLAPVPPLDGSPPADAPRPPPTTCGPPRTAATRCVYEGRVFTARVAVDGTVKFSAGDRPPLLVAPVLSGAVDNGRPSLQSTLSAAFAARSDRGRDDKVVDESFLIIPNITRYRPDPREGSRARSTRPLPLEPPGGRPDRRAHAGLAGQDPHRLEKARFLTATSELRIRRAAHAQASRLREAAAELPQRLE